MEWLQFRNPFSAWSHAVGLLLAFPATVVLLRRSNGNPLKRLGFLIFGLGMMACYAGSTLFHAVHGTPARIAWFCTLDHVGIYLLIAGTITPVALVVLEGRWRWGILALAWLLAACGIGLCLAGPRVSLPVATALYLAMGWGILTCYFELARVLPPRALDPAVLGGLLYTIGAVLNVLHWPTLWPGVIGPHEVFHLFVLAGTTAHFLFALRVVAPFERSVAAVEPVRAGVGSCGLASAGGR
jgi:hemolysin III